MWKWCLRRRFEVGDGRRGRRSGLRVLLSTSNRLETNHFRQPRTTQGGATSMVFPISHHRWSNMELRGIKQRNTLAQLSTSRTEFANMDPFESSSFPAALPGTFTLSRNALQWNNLFSTHRSKEIFRELLNTWEYEI
jgi:hypothetical protein